jgi:hypothetical protein
VLLAAACVACDTTTTASAPPSDGPDGIAASAAPDPTDCQARIEQATFDNLETIDRADECRFTAGGVAAAAAVLAKGGSRDATWSALWIQESGGTEAELVRPYLDNADASIRALAASLAARFGERRGLEVLLGLTESRDILLGSLPPTSIGEFAVRSLARMVRAADAPSGDVDIDTLAEHAKAWQGWLGERLAAMAYDPNAGWSR